MKGTGFTIGAKSGRTDWAWQKRAMEADLIRVDEDWLVKF